ncbi:DNA polymerase III subunit beta [Pseudomonas fluorescens]|uniref:Nucleotidyltransferase domain-containing protein n=1 Tax=Pseudomonas lactucae TaxID=2813360 RepID=A0A9X1C6N1_9PSED|nr:nucleotidyltransferase domain-containing protein [Pseudomonas lactucae]OPA91493.1 DNA polymerase III subunit beta [Pseudomonas fluorescens]MBN2976913.1 nucleotidyltransferase domain-containing protein [Pseudomonas lactucae]MBN2986355.1 nucleotidyltransferase domain-containing protein [Pseudomonas lactucae]OPB10415.1 DNA polymerase III subunit beta [Pseudomonas fluorescens]OPB21667.1 DNA polymerase III subunit beta [Pseudomonas fluorescens]
MRTAATGLDADGFILTVSDRPVQRQYQPLLADVCASLPQAGIGLDGIYLYGSVARGDAVPGVSDLDLTLVLHEPATAQVLEQLEAIRHELEQRHPQVTKIDFDIGSRSQVLAAENRHSWGYWLKHHCRCIWGNDLSQHFERFRPSREIALAVNGDVEQVLAGYLARIARVDTEQVRLRLQREASRKLIRATHAVCLDDASSWPQTLEEHAAMFVRCYPAKVTQIAFFLFEARNPEAEAGHFSSRLQAFLSWMVSLQK